MNEEIPDVIGTVRGYRAWKLTRDGQLLAAVHRDFLWKNGLNVARCVLTSWHGHVIPQIGCKCGFWACAEPRGTQINGTVFGVIDMSGGIVEHEKNTVVRSAKARIVAVCMPRLVYGKKLTAAVRRNYPDVRIFQTRVALLRAYPPVLTERQEKSRSRRRMLIGGLIGIQANGSFWDFKDALSPHGGWVVPDFIFGCFFGLSAVAYLARTQGLAGCITTAVRVIKLRRTLP